MSFHVSRSTMVFHLIILGMSATSSLAEWILVASTPLQKVPFYNLTRGSTKLFTVPNSFDYTDEFTCTNIHNLTMLGYGRRTYEVPNAFEEKYLEGLQAKLTRQIEDRMTNLGRSRSGRTYHIGFPSLEGALVSISLLLFAVYLIKLVMKVVYTYNARRGTTEYFGYLSNLRQPIVITRNRGRRDIEIELEGYRINDLIHGQYNFFN